MPLVFSARKNQRIVVTDRQFSIIIGSLLGDAYISPLGKIQFEHSEKAKEYVQWKFREMDGIRYQKIGHVKRNLHDKILYSYRFWTRQFFRPLRKMVYKQNGKKYISQEWLLELTPLALAIWYIDDGHYEREKKRCIIATDGFSDDDREKLRIFLKTRFNLAITLRKSGKIAMTQRETEKFFKIINPHQIECMAYKFPNPLTTIPASRNDKIQFESYNTPSASGLSRRMVV